MNAGAVLETRFVRTGLYRAFQPADTIGGNLPNHAGAIMYPNYPSPLEHLAAFAIVLAAGVLGTAIMGKYLDKVREDAAARN
ncbi:hypothetical protein [Achromobacter aloeverae]|uniref:hypothetical protein n=1 Tax=Achromobacter aloeverae TaxID=1750518 RepID=UPI00100EA647|nr:hypothetical protein [Achromobacter aloeverae]